MKNTSILIPIILIGCLAALGFLFFRAFQNVEDDRLRTNRQIVLDEADYTDEAPPVNPGVRTDYDEATTDTLPGTVYRTNSNDRPVRTEDVRAEAGDGFRELTAAERAAARSAFEARQGNDVTTAARTGARERDPEEDITYPDEKPTSPARIDEPSGNGRYLVIAGSFRQRENAGERVAALRKAGFTATRSEPFNRGTYAVALAGQSDSYRTATKLADRIKAAGFEAEVLRRR